jgi:hypothetical protein
MVEVYDSFLQITSESMSVLRWRIESICFKMAEVYDSFLQIKREIMIMINIYPIESVKGKKI